MTYSSKVTILAKPDLQFNPKGELHFLSDASWQILFSVRHSLEKSRQKYNFEKTLKEILTGLEFWLLTLMIKNGAR